MSTYTLKKGKTLFREGDPSVCMYGILGGTVGIYANYGTPEEKLLTTLEAGSFFGEMGMIDGQPRSATAVVLTENTKIDAITPESFQAYFQKRPEKVLLIMQKMSKRIRELTEAYLEACQTVAASADAEQAGAEPGGELQAKLEQLSKVYQQSGNARKDN